MSSSSDPRSVDSIPPDSESEFLLTGGKNIQYSCNSCHKNITTEFRIRCAECEDYDICADCFSAGHERKQHKNTHAYRVVDCLDKPLFTKDWSINEELMLLEGIEKFGAGNWKFIAEYLGTGKSIKALEEHYWEVYMGRHGHCLPRVACVGGAQAGREVPLSDLSTNADSFSQIPVVGGYDRLAQKPWVYKEGEAVERDFGIKAAPTTAKAKQTLETEIRDRISALPGADLAGFIPLREDFDIEHENDAELLLADMEFSPDDHPSERELKLQIIDIYDKKLQERTERKRYAIDRGLVDFKKQQHNDRRRTKEERDLVARLRMFAPFHTQEAHEALVDGLVKARRLRQHILFFQQCRKMGIRTLEQVRQYESDRKKREQEMKARRARESAPHLFESEQAKPQSSGSRRRGADDEDAELLSLDYSSRGGKRKASDSASADLMKAPGVEMLSDHEVNLCASLPLLPLHYLAIKEACVREAYRNGRLTLDGMRRIVTLEAPKDSRLFDFFVRESHLVTDPDVRGAKKAKV